MKIRSVEFTTAVKEPGDRRAPRDLPQVAFSGRSNVGKSSLINRLLRRHRSKLAKVSARPGKTQTINFYRVNDRFYLVDLPGFGYARVPGEVQETWKDLIEGYLEEAPHLRGVVHLVDARHDPTGLDEQMIAYLAGLRLPVLVALTKMDKLKRSQRAGAVERVARSLEISDEQVLPFSAKTGEGREELLRALDGLLRARESSE